MYCKNCGCSLPDDATKCENCGAVLSYGFEAGKTNPVKEEKGSVLLGILGFIFPLIGLILYLAMMHSEPKKAKSAGKGALTAFIIYLVFIVIVTISVMIPVIDTYRKSSQADDSSYVESYDYDDVRYSNDYDYNYDYDYYYSIDC
ncbi:MAG: zinc ribbon domain-containing protein [Ruminococcus sp.]|nr:zinc ribbon domain-containing protein [Ruminococcus sp.]MDY4909517.1 zinc ribbon domain-containing protein [Candidatus Fimenecus sp.]